MAQKRKLHEPRWALVPALRAPEHLLHPPPMLSTQTRSSTKRALSREPFTNRNFPDETIPSVDKKRLLALIQDLAQTQERQDALQGALQTVKMEKSQAQGSVLALQRETAELKDLKIRLEKELNEALESLQKYEAQVKMLEEVVHRPRPKTHEIAIGPASSLALDEASISKDCRKNESLHESALELQKEVVGVIRMLIHSPSHEARPSVNH